MLDHVSLRVQDLDRALAFYKPALAAIGYEVLMEFPGTVGMGTGGKPDLWISQTDQPVSPIHIALSSTRPSVDAFHAAATAAGGSDNGSPGLRADYHPHYYAAFVRDPDGNNIEIVCHEDPAAVKAKVKAKPVVKAKAKAKAAPKKATSKKAAAAKPRKPAKTAKKKSAKSAKKRR